MSLFLGIYHRGNRISAAAVQPMVDAFGRFPRRFLTRRDFPGCILVSANELQGESVFAEVSANGPLAAVVGTVVIDLNMNGSAANTFVSAWLQEGVACLPYLHGAFTAAVYDPQNHSLTLVNDKFGMRPLFVCESGEYIAFCNEVEPLQHLPGFHFAVHEEALADYFCLGMTLGEDTLVQGISNLPAATCRRISPMDDQVQPYWQADIAVNYKATIEDHAYRIATTLKDIVQQTADQVSNLQCLLSAGADSRLILTCLTPVQRARIPFLTSKLSILSADEDRDLIGATALAKHLGLQHRILEIAFSERDFGPQYFEEVKQAREAKILGGWHGGEYLGGYCDKVMPITAIPGFAEMDQRLRSVFSWRFRRRLVRHPHESFLENMGKMTAEQPHFQFQINQFARSFFTTIYGGSRGSWLQPFEIINQGFSPFWDSRFLQQLLSVPFNMVADYRLYNVIFRDCLAELAHLPSNSPLTLRSDTALAPMTAGIEPKAALKPQYQNALARYAADPLTWQRGIYRKRRMRKGLADENADSTMRLIDFEAWMRRA